MKLPSGGRSVAWSWEHYRYAKKPSNEFRDMQEKVQLLFWVSSIHFSSFSNAFDNSSTNGFHPFYLCACLQNYFAMEKGKELQCMAVLQKICTKMVTDMHYEARVSCVRNWYAEKQNVRISKAQA